MPIICCLLNIKFKNLKDYAFKNVCEKLSRLGIEKHCCIMNDTLSNGQCILHIQNEGNTAFQIIQHPLLNGIVVYYRQSEVAAGQLQGFLDEADCLVLSHLGSDLVMGLKWLWFPWCITREWRRTGGGGEILLILLNLQQS